MSIPTEDTRLATLNHYLRAVAILFDFVNPVLALRRLIDQGGKLWLDEPEPRGKHWALYCLDRLQKKPQRCGPGPPYYGYGYRPYGYYGYGRRWGY
jgi:hypothetical protein